ncbi:hypothetical protein B9T33_15550 [Acinetobacter sp. ANC 5054]|uniref:DUF6587 family protein n=1 Tax=Acinetobacter sp. ANC 5054 TaxID=1977877 RepID=UPI000A334444|nr:DUF6587 family protein [Acinetobacter sp. ANC 5054]OTG76947.1 hypothetical protein B9T33_15550 [Acinetobacter sp. ANC 5054]
MIEILIVAALVIWSAVVVFKKVFPKTSNSVFSSLSESCARQGWNGLAKWLKPKMAAGCAGGCGCSTEDKPTAKKAEVQAVKWK